MTKLMIQDPRRMNKLFKTISRHLKQTYIKEAAELKHADYYPVKRSPDKTILYPEEIKMNATDAQLRRYNG